MSFALCAVNRAVSQGRLVALLIVLSLLAGCVSAEEDFKRRMDARCPTLTKADAISRMGPPMDVKSDGQGGELLTWTFRKDGAEATLFLYFRPSDGPCYFWRLNTSSPQTIWWWSY